MHTADDPQLRQRVASVADGGLYDVGITVTEQLAPFPKSMLAQFAAPPSDR